jgi:hypothetical protein
VPFLACRTTTTFLLGDMSGSKPAFTFTAPEQPPDDSAFSEVDFLRDNPAWRDYGAELPFFSSELQLGANEQAAGRLQGNRELHYGGENSPWFNCCVSDDLMVGPSPVDREEGNGDEPVDWRLRALRFEMSFDKPYVAVGVLDRNKALAILGDLSDSKEYWRLSSDGWEMKAGVYEDSRQGFKMPGTATVTFSYREAPGGARGRLAVSSDAFDREVVLEDDLRPGCVPFLGVASPGSFVKIDSVQILAMGGALTKSAVKR